ncbi:hypothetical protein M8C21_024413, partial [Ambrosia artemisiifolia]
TGVDFEFSPASSLLDMRSRKKAKGNMRMEEKAPTSDDPVLEMITKKAGGIVINEPKVSLLLLPNLESYLGFLEEILQNKIKKCIARHVVQFDLCIFR